MKYLLLTMGFVFGVIAFSNSAHAVWVTSGDAGTCTTPSYSCSCTVDTSKGYRYWGVQGAPVQTETGTPDTAVGSGLNCANCCGCPDNPPTGNIDCSTELSVSYTESVNASVTGTVEWDWGPVDASVAVTAGVENGQEIGVSITCSATATPCHTCRVNAVMGVTENINYEVSVNFYRCVYLDGACSVDNPGWYYSPTRPCSNSLTRTIRLNSASGEGECQGAAHTRDPNGDCTGENLGN